LFKIAIFLIAIKSQHETPSKAAKIICTEIKTRQREQKLHKVQISNCTWCVYYKGQIKYLLYPRPIRDQCPAAVHIAWHWISRWWCRFGREFGSDKPPL